MKYGKRNGLHLFSSGLSANYFCWTKHPEVEFGLGCDDVEFVPAELQKDEFEKLYIIYGFLSL